MRSYKVFKVAGNGDGWRVVFYIDQEEVGGGQFPTAEQSDDAGVDFMFGGM
jgi:hypothetical protein